VLVCPETSNSERIIFFTSFHYALEIRFNYYQCPVSIMRLQHSEFTSAADPPATSSYLSSMLHVLGNEWSGIRYHTHLVIKEVWKVCYT